MIDYMIQYNIPLGGRIEERRIYCSRDEACQGEKITSADADGTLLFEDLEALPTLITRSGTEAIGCLWDDREPI